MKILILLFLILSACAKSNNSQSSPIAYSIVGTFVSDCTVETHNSSKSFKKYQKYTDTLASSWIDYFSDESCSSFLEKTESLPYEYKISYTSGNIFILEPIYITPIVYILLRRTDLGIDEYKSIGSFEDALEKSKIEWPLGSYISRDGIK